MTQRATQLATTSRLDEHIYPTLTEQVARSADHFEAQVG